VVVLSTLTWFLSISLNIRLLQQALRASGFHRPRTCSSRIPIRVYEYVLPFASRTPLTYKLCSPPLDPFHHSNLLSLKLDPNLLYQTAKPPSSQSYWTLPNGSEENVIQNLGGLILRRLSSQLNGRPTLRLHST
jgi:hypothetical protein